MSLQNMIDEILLRKQGRQMKQIADRQKSKKEIEFLSRDKPLFKKGFNNVNVNLESHISTTSSTSRTFTQNSLFENDTVISNDDL